MTVQTTVDSNIRESLPGVIADISPHQTGSYAAEASAIDFGLAVVRGTAEDQAKLATATGQAFLGLTVRTLDRVNPTVGSNLSQYAEKDTMSVLRWGRIQAKPKTIVAAGDPVYFYHTANGGKVPGELVNADDVGFTDLVVGAQWDTASAADGIAIIRLEN